MIAIFRTLDVHDVDIMMSTLSLDLSLKDLNHWVIEMPCEGLESSFPLRLLLDPQHGNCNKSLLQYCTVKKSAPVPVHG